MKTTCNLPAEAIDFINNLTYTLAASYIVSIFTYWLTVTLPHIRKTSSVLVNTVEDLRMFKDEFYEFSHDICDDDWLKVPNTEDTFM